jgi:hypothetical protein
MRVRCVRLLDHDGQPILRRGEPAQSNGSLTVGRVYTVLELEVDTDASCVIERVALRIESDDSTPGLFSPRGFEIVDARLSGSWRVEIADHWITLGPEAWNQVGFWEDFFDGKPEAEAMYRAALFELEPPSLPDT